MLLASTTWRDYLADPVARVFENIIAYLPNVVAAIALALVGLATAYLFRALGRRLVRYAQNRLRRDTSVSNSVQAHWFYQSLSNVIGGVIFWIVLLFFLAAGVEALGLQAISGLFSSLTIYLPRVLAVAIIVFAGFVLGDFVYVWVNHVASRSGIAIAEPLGRGAQITVWLIAILMSIDQLGISSNVIIIALAIVGGSFFGAAALAFGLGARTTVSNIIAIHYVHKVYGVGSQVKIGDLQGRIAEITRVAVVLETPQGRVLVPARRFNEEVSVLIEEGA